MKRAIICDCDGTISLRTNRDTYDFNSSIDDKPNSSIIELLKIYKESGFSIIIVTAREEKFKKITEKWLFINNIEYDQIFFRDNKDARGRASFENAIAIINVANQRELDVIEKGTGLKT